MPPILLMKRMLDDFDESEEEEEGEEGEEETKEPQPKRPRVTTERIGSRSDDELEEKDQDVAGITKEATLSEDIMNLMIPRMEAKLQQLVDGAAMRMLDVLGQKMNRLESRMEEMQNEWRKSIGNSPTYDAKRSNDRIHQRSGTQYQFGQRHQSAVQQYYGRTQAQPTTNEQVDGSSRNNDPLQSFFQEAAQAADSPAIVCPPNNRRAPFMARRSKPQAAPEFVDAIQASRANNFPPGTHETPPEDVPQYRLARGSESVTELWHEFFVGSAEKPAINELDHKYGSAWRWKDSKEGVYYSMRRVVIDEIQSRVEARCPNAVGATGDIWLAVCEEMDAERMAGNSSLNQYIFELKRRDRAKSAPRAKTYSPDDPYPPPEPVLSRTTPSVQKLWTEWFVGKQNYNGYAVFPSIVHLNHRFGNSWRHFTTPEYAIYLKRRCIIDIALRRIVEVGGDKEAATKKVLKAMDAERIAHNLSLVQYHAWAREKYGYHAAVRTHLPKYVADLGERPEEVLELEARINEQQDEENELVGEKGNERVVDEADESQAMVGSEELKEAESVQDGSIPPSPASLG